MLEKYNVGSAVARLCGRVAKLQLGKHLDFLCEQAPDLYYEGDWPDVLLVLAQFVAETALNRSWLFAK